MDRFLVDTVTLSKMTPAQRISEFMREHCRIPSEVLHEAQSLHEWDVLALLEYRTTVDVLRQVGRVVSSLSPKDKLLDLYHNEGNGDVFLLAIARAEMEVEAAHMWPDQWIIATDDKGLRQKAAELNIETCSSEELVKLLS